MDGVGCPLEAIAHDIGTATNSCNAPIPSPKEGGRGHKDKSHHDEDFGVRGLLTKSISNWIQHPSFCDSRDVRDDSEHDWDDACCRGRSRGGVRSRLLHRGISQFELVSSESLELVELYDSLFVAGEQRFAVAIVVEVGHFATASLSHP